MQIIPGQNPHSIFRDRNGATLSIGDKVYINTGKDGKKRDEAHILQFTQNLLKIEMSSGEITTRISRNLVRIFNT